jgi:tRNA pseudouridine55 synthase
MIHGLIVFNKPLNLTSHSVVEKVRQSFPGQKVGHFGTLDPRAEGVLLVGIGNATRLSNFFMKKRKFYTGKIIFGIATSTYDSEGTPLSEKREVDLRQLDIESLLSQFRGEILQTPPMFSAKKFKGKPLYKYARKKKKFDLKPVKVQVFSLKGKIEGKDTLRFEAVTSAGTYIRSLAHDLGLKVGSGAYLAELRREGVGEFSLEDAVEIEELAGDLGESDILNMVIPIESLLPEFPKVIVNETARQGILNGMPLMVRHIVKIFSHEVAANYRLFDEQGRLLAIARRDEEMKCFKPYIVFSD